MSVKLTNVITEPPTLTSEISVFAVGKAQSAFIWWILTDLSSDSENAITGWEIYRYRHYPGGDKEGDWLYKGKTAVAGYDHRSCTIQSLHDGCLYKFSIRCLYTRGPPLEESKCSSFCLIEDSLPTGWLRLFDEESNKFYYANMRTKESRWIRPELDPLFLEDSIAIYFTPLELTNLRTLFDSELEQFGCVSLFRFQSCLIVIGEGDVTEIQLEELFKNFTRAKSKTTSLTSWTHFMDIIRCLKKRRVKKNRTLLRSLHSFFSSKVKQKTEKIVKIHQRSRRVLFPKDVGDWVLAHDRIEGLPYYCHKQSGLTKWDIPNAVRTYLSADSEAKFLPLLDSGDLEILRQYFDCLDITQSGSLSKSDLWPLGEALVIRKGAGSRGSFLFFASILVDTNMNGYMEFEEFCTLMHCLASRGTSRKNFVWKNVDYDFEYRKSHIANQPQLHSENIDSANNPSVPLPLLSAIGFNILASRRKWLENLEQEAGTTKMNQSMPFIAIYDRVRSFRIAPALQTPRLDRHSNSCFCGCRRKVITTPR